MNSHHKLLRRRSSEFNHICYYLNRANHVSFPQSWSAMDAASCWESVPSLSSKKVANLKPVHEGRLRFQSLFQM